ncbi:hypothetical protein V6N12_069224 [Hibiscus sabdariffa]|uniref:Uncharacterized protein n=1 Tax=Hibiscus sabdariffa TaxID=183260 RepID=A0ABR2FDD9_9ROSI
MPLPFDWLECGLLLGIYLSCGRRWQVCSQDTGMWVFLFRVLEDYGMSRGGGGAGVWAADGFAADASDGPSWAPCCRASIRCSWLQSWSSLMSEPAREVGEFALTGSGWAVGWAKAGACFDVVGITARWQSAKIRQGNAKMDLSLRQALESSFAMTSPMLNLVPKTRSLSHTQLTGERLVRFFFFLGKSFRDFCSLVYSGGLSRDLDMISVEIKDSSASSNQKIKVVDFSGLPKNESSNPKLPIGSRSLTHQEVREFMKKICSRFAAYKGTQCKSYSTLPPGFG